MILSFKRIVSLFGIVVLFSSFFYKNISNKITIKNSLDFERNELVSIRFKDYKCFSNSKNHESLLIKDKNGKQLVTQLVDNNLDGIPDELLFQAAVPANSEVTYTVITTSKSIQKRPLDSITTFARFVPERIDDFAWENDKVAFRTYGPEAQRLTEAGRTDGTLSSGIDLWLKRVPYSIIDSWYFKNVKSPGYYHIDHGEGYDPYHVGSSRGTGGTGIWENDSLYVSKNYVKSRIIARGPLRTIFELDYAPWSKYGVNETKRISLDLGTNFSKFESKISSTSSIPNFTLGITLHEKKGISALNVQKGIYRYWEPIDDSFVGEGIVIDPKVVKKALNYQSKTPDQSQILIVAAPENNSLIYYIGFSWLKSGQIQSVQDWDLLLEKQSKIIQNPLLVTIK
ncbi:DUF4861 family protein [Flavobacterium cellulosilyticum]|uniref:DUF4861 domain-containing protein n=1 Tax=Flavobacterium cellulosilyticum TaxID=2541731 RepID=A0A4R5C3P1_9FLAO|nr:DUF4861 family protein [Flavobacterium cellulosilyticum]TDD94218.1 DUF4861 domain-containing protein [Flavobacterium cellulosilyticum]